MEENRLNDNDKTMVFNPVTNNTPKSEPKKEENPYNSSLPYSKNQKKYDEYEDYDEYDEEDDYEDDEYYDDEESSHRGSKTNTTLIILTIVLSVVFVATLIWGIFSFIKLKEENTKEEIVAEEKPEEIPVEISVEEPQEEEEKNILYNIIFYKDSVEKEGDFYTVRVKLYNKSMVFKEEKRVIINESTEIAEDGKQLSLVSFISVIEGLAQENVVFKGKINEKTKEVVNISYEKAILEVLEEEDSELQIDEETEGEDTKEDVSSKAITTGIEEPAEGEKKVITQ